MRQTIMLMAACAALLASCTNEVGEGLGIDTPIQVTASVEGIMTTRAENTAESLKEFGLSIKDGEGYTGNYAGENIKVSKPKDASAWTLADEVLYKGSGQTYFAYAPYDADMTGETLTFTVDPDQATNDLQGSDLLYAAPAEVTDATIPVNFSHKLSKLTVTLTPEGFGPDEVSFTGVTLQGTLPITTLALVDGESVEAGALGEASGDATDIKMWESSTNTYECILVPQEATYSVLINAEVGGEQKTYVYTPSAAYKFESDQSYTLALKVKKADEPTAIESIDVKGWGDGNAIALEDGDAIEPYTVSGNTYTVYTVEGLQAWATAAKSSSDPINCTLANDIDMTGQSWTPLSSYAGTFDGGDHTIRNLSTSGTEGGFISVLSSDGVVKNLTLVNPTITATSGGAGAVVGFNFMGTIENCHVVGGRVECSYHWGGMSGGITRENSGRIIACSSSATVTMEGTVGSSRAGGIVGSNSGTILACYATGSVTGSDGMEGAIAGENMGMATITACYWSGDAVKGVGGYGSADGTTKVEGDVTWATAMTEMNKALQTDGSGYQWIEYTGDDKEKRPLVIATE